MFTLPGKLQSRKFWVAIIGALFMVLNDGLGLGIDQETVENALMLLLAWLGVEGAADVVKGIRGGKPPAGGP